MDYKITEAEKDKFYEFLFKWQELFGLQRWSVYLGKKSTKSLAELVVDKNKEHKACTVRLGETWKNIPPNDHNLELVACHEMLHLLLHDFKETIQEQPYNDVEILSKEHEVVNTLERLLMGRLSK